MNKISLVIALAVILSASCKNKGTKDDSGANDKEDTSHFFQTSVIFQKDIKDIDSTPYFIYKIVIANDKKDSSAINTAAFKELAQHFLKPDISSKELKPQYKESIFEDQTTSGFTINYSTLNKELEVQDINILLKDDGKTVKNIFIRKFYNYSDSSAIEQLTWKPNERFQIIRSVQHKDNTETNYQTSVVWNSRAKD